MKCQVKKIVILWISCFCMIFAIPNRNIGANISKYVTAEAPHKEMKKCNTSYDCRGDDPRMVCSKNNTCACAKFHDWKEERKKCMVSIAKICSWLKATASTELETVPQQEDFDVESRTDNVTVLRPKWADYAVDKEKGIDRITLVICPMLLGAVMIIFVYGAILLDCM